MITKTKTVKNSFPFPRSALAEILKLSPSALKMYLLFLSKDWGEHNGHLWITPAMSMELGIVKSKTGHYNAIEELVNATLITHTHTIKVDELLAYQYRINALPDRDKNPEMDPPKRRKAVKSSLKKGQQCNKSGTDQPKKCCTDQSKNSGTVSATNVGLQDTPDNTHNNTNNNTGYLKYQEDPVLNLSEDLPSITLTVCSQKVTGDIRVELNSVQPSEEDLALFADMDPNDTKASPASPEAPGTDNEHKMTQDTPSSSNGSRARLMIHTPPVKTFGRWSSDQPPLSKRYFDSISDPMDKWNFIQSREGLGLFCDYKPTDRKAFELHLKQQAHAK